MNLRGGDLVGGELCLVFDMFNALHGYTPPYATLYATK